MSPAHWLIASHLVALKMTLVLRVREPGRSTRDAKGGGVTAGKVEEGRSREEREGDGKKGEREEGRVRR